MARLFRLHGSQPVADVPLKQPVKKKKLCEIFSEPLEQECYIYYEQEHLSTLVVNEGWFIPSKPGRYFIKFSDEHNIRIFEEVSEKLKLIAEKYGHERDDSGCFESATEDISLEKSSSTVDTVEPWKQKILEIRRFEDGYKGRIFMAGTDLKVKEQWTKLEALSIQDQNFQIVRICGKNKDVSLKKILTNDEIDLYYQIRVDITDIFQEYPGLVEKFCVVVSGLPRGIAPFFNHLERKYYEKLKYISSNQLYIFSRKQNGESTGYFIIIWDSPKNAEKCLEHFYYYDIDPCNRNLVAYSLRDVVNVTKEKTLAIQPLRDYLKDILHGIELLHLEHLPPKQMIALVHELKPKTAKICTRTNDTIPDELFQKIPESFVFQCGRASQYPDFLRYVSLHRLFTAEFQFQKPDPVENKYSKWARNFIEGWITGQLDEGLNSRLEMTQRYNEHEVVESLLDSFFKWIEGPNLKNITETVSNLIEMEKPVTGLYLMARNQKEKLERKLVIYRIQKELQESVVIIKVDHFEEFVREIAKRSRNSTRNRSNQPSDCLRKLWEFEFPSKHS